MELIKDTAIPVDSWSLFLKNNRHGTPFQSPEFYRLMNIDNHLSANAIAITDSGRILSLAVITFQEEGGWKKYFSKRAIIYGGPLFGANHTANELLLNAISELTKKRAIYVETRNFSDYSVYQEIFRKVDYKYIASLNFHIDTSDLQKLLRSMSSSRARQIRKAKRNSVKWRIADNIGEVKLFYNLLADLYKQKIGKPIPPYSFFESFFKSELGKYILIIWDDKVIGGIMCPILENRAIYEFYICGLDTEYKEQYPSVMATWAAVEYANQNDIPLFDFMGAGQPDIKYGVREFKARFGGKLVEYGRFLKINNYFLYHIGKSSIKLMRSIRV